MSARGDRPTATIRGRPFWNDQPPLPATKGWVSRRKEKGTRRRLPFSVFVAVCPGANNAAMPWRAMVGVTLAALVVAGCGGAPERVRTQREPSGAAKATAASTICPSRGRALAGVYHPQRLRVIDPCRAVKGEVTVLHREEDGDLHFDLDLGRRDRNLLAAANLSRQHGDLVVEFMPRDRGHLPEPRVGDRVSLVGAFVEDLDHAWNEIHPVWQVRINGGRPHRSGPRFGGSPPSARSIDALRSCVTVGGAGCRGYVPRGHGGGRAGERDCSDFRTQRQAQRYFRSKGGPARDPDKLDADRNGVACESLPR